MNELERLLNDVKEALPDPDEVLKVVDWWEQALKLKRNLTIIQRLKLRILGYTYIGHYAKPGWRGELPFFVVRCREGHGLFSTYPQGHQRRLECPRCLEEERKRRR